MNDAAVIAALRARDERVFEELMRMYNASLLRVAQIYVASRAVAEEVVQETWIGVLNGIDRFEGRSSLKTWIFRILTNIAKTRGQREGRTVPFSSCRQITSAGRVTGRRSQSPGRRSGCSPPRRGRSSSVRSKSYHRYSGP